MRTLQCWSGKGGSDNRGRMMQLMAVMLAACACLSATAAAARVNNPPTLDCNDAMKAAFRPDAHTQVVAVRLITRGTPLRPSGAADSIAAASDLCLVKLLVGPGASAEPDHRTPSWSAGIGIEVWLPAPAAWNHRIRNFGGGGWAGGAQRQPDQIGSPIQAIYAANLGFAVATTDTGHEPVMDISFAFLSNGKLNAESLNDFIVRSVVELGSGLVDQSQKITVAASAIAEKKTVGHRS